MKALTEYIFEAQIDGLKNVKLIRHYTTASGLINILKDGFIEARESSGDSDWKGYDLHDKRVVSFHDARVDPEWDQFIDSNNRKISMAGLTPTLGLHDSKVCACIEIDYDKLDELIQNKTHLLNIYGKKAEEFVNLWNKVINRSREDNGIVTYYKCKADFCEFIIDTINGNDDELKNSLEYIWDTFGLRRKKNDPEAQLALDKIRKIFLKYYTDDELNEKEEDECSLRSDTMFINDVSHYFGWGMPYKFPRNPSYITQIQNELENNKRAAGFYERVNLKTFSNEETEQLSKYAIKFDVVSVIKMMRNHGWKMDDSKLFTIFGGPRRQGNDDKYYDGTLLRWIDELLRSKTKIINANIEIRIPANVNINKDNCKIIIFDGICEAIKANRLLNLPQKYNKLYNIEHIQ